MRMIKEGLLVASIALLSACSGGEAASSRQAINEGEGGTSQGGTGGSTGGTGGALQCPQGGKVGAIRVTFNCTSVDVESCKDLSNIVLEFADGTRQRFEGLNDTDGSFSGTGSNAGKTVVGVWVKAGNNKSGDGPGYGERFDAPATNCADGGSTGGTGGSTGGTGGSTGGTGGSTGGTGGGNGGSGGTPYDPPN